MTPKITRKREGAQDLVDPVRHDQQQQQEPQPRRAGDLRHVVGERIADGEIEHGDEDAGDDGQEEGLEVHRRCTRSVRAVLP